MKLATKGSGTLSPGTVLAWSWGARGKCVLDSAPSGACTEQGESGAARPGHPGRLRPGIGKPTAVALRSLLLAERGGDRRDRLLAHKAALAQGWGSYGDCFLVRVLLGAVGAWGAEWSCLLRPEQAKGPAGVVSRHPNCSWG